MSWKHWESLGPDTMEISTSDLKQIVGTDDLRIEFTGADGHEYVAEFSPAGIDADKLELTCGLRPK